MTEDIIKFTDEELRERESSIEQDSWKIAESRGWFRVKIMRTSKCGFPDHYFIRNGITILVEFKAPGEQPSPQQKKRIWQLRKHGARVEIIDNVKQARAIFH